MTDTKLSSWQFNLGEPVSLYWYSSPSRSGRGKNFMTVYLKTKSGSFVEYECPWGNLPFLSLGSIYIDGQITGQRDAKIEPGYFDVKHVFSKEISTAYNLIPKSLYPLLDCSRDAGKENCVNITLDSGNHLIFPCITIIRNVLCPSVLLSNQILTSGGLDELCFDNERDELGHFFANFSGEYKPVGLTKKMISRVIWIMSNHNTNTAWQQCYVSYASRQKLSVSFPFSEDERIQYWGVRHGNTTLVLYFKASNIKYPYEEIIYTHPYMMESDHTLDSVRTRFYPINKLRENDPIILSDENDLSPAGSGQAEVYSDCIDNISYTAVPRVTHNKERVPGGSIRRLPFEAERHGKFTTNPQRGNVNSRSVEVGSRSDDDLEIFDDYENVPVGLEHLYSALSHIRRDYRIVSVLDSVQIFSGNSTFEKVSETQPRSYIHLDLLSNIGSHMHVLEVSHIDTWSISTLVFWGGDPNDVAKLIESLIGSLVHNSGHWNKDWFSNYPEWGFRTIKHMDNRTAQRWADLILATIYCM